MASAGPVRPMKATYCRRRNTPLCRQTSASHRITTGAAERGQCSRLNLNMGDHRPVLPQRWVYSCSGIGATSHIREGRLSRQFAIVMFPFPRSSSLGWSEMETGNQFGNARPATQSEPTPVYSRPSRHPARGPRRGRLPSRSSADADARTGPTTHRPPRRSLAGDRSPRLPSPEARPQAVPHCCDASLLDEPLEHDVAERLPSSAGKRQASRPDRGGNAVQAPGVTQRLDYSATLRQAALALRRHPNTTLTQEGRFPPKSPRACFPGLRRRRLTLPEGRAYRGERAARWRGGGAVAPADAAAEIVRHYLQRWRLEDFFRVLKSGCRGAPDLPHRGPAAARDRDQRRDRVAHHSDDAAGTTGSQLCRRTDVHGSRVGISQRLRPQIQLVRSGQPRPGALGGPSSPRSSGLGRYRPNSGFLGT